MAKAIAAKCTISGFTKMAEAVARRTKTEMKDNGFASYAAKALATR
jgi:hypothetical protein